MARRVTRGAAPRLAGALLLTALLAGCSPKTETKTNDLDAALPKTTTLSVQTVTARAGTLTAQRSASATIQAERDSQVATQSSGAVQSIPVSQGEAVAKGDVLVKLDDTAQQQALDNARLQQRQAQISLDQTRQSTSQGTGALQASVTSAQAALAQAEQNAQSAEKLYGLGGISLADVQAARSQLAQAQAQLAQARNTLEQNGRSAGNSVPLAQVQLDTARTAVRQAEQNLSRTAVRAPFAGTVADVLTEVGEFAGQGTPVIRLVDPGSVRARVGVPTADAAALTEGVKFNLSYGGKSYVATVVDSSGIAGKDRLVPITATIEGGNALPVGAAARASYRATLGSGLLIPASALQVEGGENAVYVARSGKAEREVVQVVAESGNRVVVSGLQDGDAVISPLPAGVQDGAKVVVK
ncbi:efflux RND transporter periplasmic adaptor subunit [Deinococcus radiodurans]|jgi:RND family efflux transporter, MFP subunit|nr:efflux transporter periplasmic adaptor subunit [Deinococcus radiodurans R1 = ATCC 13939 = DSM 20539]QEM72677.1 efflux RND transporter periplasmic adaptor subunit [Deinococcus radiodurans]QIP30114.1 efflux RND transporter periplasmic adaptor subunit [Deinococcus radiodurans]QIP33103.1 efflux RND transporter periplasmic adaptor subunit [Deinococcus radiodurans]UDL01666.1 efflux RND transporter periplasmic adaptor subunit [Deinococcus radiodurans R1 = ATCC 13939 = DSM 20539]